MIVKVTTELLIPHGGVNLVELEEYVDSVNSLRDEHDVDAGGVYVYVQPYSGNSDLNAITASWTL